MRACCPTDRTTAAASGEYSPVGTMDTIGSLDCYTVGSGSTVVVMITDIFGLHQNNFELADNLASSRKWRVIIPDLFRGNAWPAVHFPPRGVEQSTAFSNFLATLANPAKRVGDIQSLITALKTTQKAQKIALLAFCWGCKVAALTGANDASQKSVAVIAGAHPAFLEASDAVSAEVPTLWLPTGDDDLSDYISGLGAKQGKTVYLSEDFKELFHGFLAARGDWTDPMMRDQASAAIKMIAAFFDKYLN